MRRTSGWRRPWGPAGKRIAHHDGHLARRRRGRDGVAVVEEEAGADASPVAAPDDARTVDSAPPSLGGENTAAVAPRRRQREQGERAAALVARDDEARFAKKQKSVDVRQQTIDALPASGTLCRSRCPSAVRNRLALTLDVALVCTCSSCLTTMLVDEESYCAISCELLTASIVSSVSTTVGLDLRLCQSGARSC